MLLEHLNLEQAMSFHFLKSTFVSLQNGLYLLHVSFEHFLFIPMYFVFYLLLLLL